MQSLGCTGLYAYGQIVTVLWKSSKPPVCSYRRGAKTLRPPRAQQTPDFHTITSILAAAFRLALFCILATQAFSQRTSSTNEFWPELDAFLTLHQNVRLILSAKSERDAEFHNTELGSEIELSLHRFGPVLDLPWADQDATRRTLISIRAGYRYKRSFDTTLPVHENRPDLEFTLRWVFHENILVSNRARWELRFVSGSPFSWRYRDRLRLEKDFKLHRYTFTWYIATEPFYNSRTSRWDRFRFSSGAVFPVSRWFSVEPYYLREIAPDAQPRSTNALGLVGQVHWPK
jgi:hypothetical protein